MQQICDTLLFAINVMDICVIYISASSHPPNIAPEGLPKGQFGEQLNQLDFEKVIYYLLAIFWDKF